MLHLQHASTSIKVIIVGHKCDAEADREVMTTEGEKMAQHYDSFFFETSAVNGHNVSSVSIMHSMHLRPCQCGLQFDLATMKLSDPK